MKGSFLFLGTGASTGVPVISCKCAVCTSSSQLNKRLRASGLWTIGKKQFLVDAGPDLRDQALRYNIDHLDGVLLTHSHYDHVGGFDELRLYYFLQKLQLPILTSRETYEAVQKRYDYLFKSRPGSPARIPQFDFQVMERDFDRVTFEGIPLDIVTYVQGGMKVTGFRYGTFAYISDIRHYEEEVVTRLQGVETLILSALRHEHSDLHFTIDEAVAFSRAVGARRTFLTHISHFLEHDETNAKLPEGVHMAHDGLEIPF